MRNLIPTLLLAALGSTVFAQSYQRPKSFNGVPWGASQSQVIHALEKSGATVPEDLEGTVSNTLEVVGGQFAGQAVVQWTLEFAGGKFVAGTAVLKPSDTAKALYRELKQKLVAKYGPYTSEGRTGAETPEERRQRAAAGIRATRSMIATWKFTPTLADKQTMTMSCEYGPPEGTDPEDETQYLVTIRYSNDTLKSQNSPATTAAAPSSQAQPSAQSKTTRPLKADCL
jgi:hypothetical protein